LCSADACEDGAVALKARGIWRRLVAKAGRARVHGLEQVSATYCGSQQRTRGGG
jgi:hypothetical protein